MLELCFSTPTLSQRRANFFADLWLKIDLGSSTPYAYVEITRGPSTDMATVNLGTGGRREAILRFSDEWPPKIEFKREESRERVALVLSVLNRVLDEFPEPTSLPDVHDWYGRVDALARKYFPDPDHPIHAWTFDWLPHHADGQTPEEAIACWIEAYDDAGEEQ